MNLNQLAREITLAEGGKVNQNIAQVKETLRITLEKLAPLSIAELLQLLAPYRGKSTTPAEAKQAPELDPQEKLVWATAVALKPLVAEQLRIMGVGIGRRMVHTWARALAELSLKQVRTWVGLLPGQAAEAQAKEESEK